MLRFIAASVEIVRHMLPRVLKVLPTPYNARFMKYTFSVVVLVLMTCVVSAYARDKGVCPTEENSSVEIPQRRAPAPPFPGLHYVGTVTMRLSLSDTGYICGVEVVKGIQPDLDKQAVNAIKGQIFQPILLEGKPIAGVMTIQRDFFRGDTSDTVFSENVDAASDDIPFEEKQV